VALDPETVAVLRNHRKNQAAERLAAGRLWDQASDVVFPDKLGVPLHPAHLAAGAGPAPSG
jgi:hypothetical protein